MNKFLLLYCQLFHFIFSFPFLNKLLLKIKRRFKILGFKWRCWFCSSNCKCCVKMQLLLRPISVSFSSSLFIIFTLLLTSHQCHSHSLPCIFATPSSSFPFPFCSSLPFAVAKPAISGTPTAIFACHRRFSRCW